MTESFEIESLKRLFTLGASYIYFMQNFALISMVYVILHKNLRLKNGGHFKINPPYVFLGALDFISGAFHIDFLEHSMFFLEHSIVFMVHLIVFLEHSIFFLEHSIIFLEHSIYFLKHLQN